MYACNDKVLNCREKKHVLKICPAAPWVQVTHKMASAIANCRTKASCDKGNTTLHETDNNNHYYVWINYSAWIKCLNANPIHSFLPLVQNGKIRPLKCQLLRIQYCLQNRYLKIPIRRYLLSNRYLLSEDSSQKGVRNEWLCDQLKYAKECFKNKRKAFNLVELHEVYIT